MTSTELEFDLLDRLSANKSVADAACPACGPQCKAEVNRRRRVLRIWIDDGFATYKCARCDVSGWARDNARNVTRPHRAQTPESKPEKNKADLAAYLWAQSLPLNGSAAEVYLKARGCFVESPALRFLPARNSHPPSMIARFGIEGIVTGVHLTKLRSDGMGKAGAEKDKIMIGPSQGQPIMIADNQDRGELLVAEGIEDAATLSIVTGWSARAAGSAGRLAAVVAASEGFERIYLAVDDDLAGRRALQASRSARPDIVPLNLSKVLAARDKTDANAAASKFGADAVLASIEWCDARARFAQGEIGYHAMMRAAERSQQIFSAIAEDVI